MLLEVLSLEIYPNVTKTPTAFHPSHVETDRQRSITVVSTDTTNRLAPDTASP